MAGRKWQPRLLGKMLGADELGGRPPAPKQPQAPPFCSVRSPPRGATPQRIQGWMTAMKMSVASSWKMQLKNSLMDMVSRKSTSSVSCGRRGQGRGQIGLGSDGTHKGMPMASA